LPKLSGFLQDFSRFIKEILIFQQLKSLTFVTLYNSGNLITRGLLENNKKTL